ATNGRYRLLKNSEVGDGGELFAEASVGGRPGEREQLEQQARVARGLEATLHERDARVQLATVKRDRVAVLQRERALGVRDDGALRARHPTVVELHDGFAVLRRSSAAPELDAPRQSGERDELVPQPRPLVEPVGAEELGHVTPGPRRPACGSRRTDRPRRPP